MDPILLALQNRRKKTAAAKPTPKAPARPGVSAPSPPDFTALLAELGRGPVDRTDEEWAALLDPRIAPYTQAIEGSTLRGRAFNEYNLETKAQTNKDLGAAFLGILTGGKTGDEAMAYSKQNFGGSYLGAQAMSIASDRLAELTNDFDENDWKITSQYLEAMDEIPAIREELRATIEKQDMDDHTRNVTEATLLMDETWRYWQENRKNFEADRDFAENKRLNNEKMKAARETLGLDKENTRADNKTAARRAATGEANASLRAASLALQAARDERKNAKDKVSIRQADDRIRISKENLRLAQERLRQEKKPGGTSAAKTAETTLGVAILKDRDVILGTPGKYPKSPRVGGMSYEDAKAYIEGLAYEQMGSYRSKTYIDNWVRAKLRVFFPTQRPGQRQSGP